MNPGDVVDGRFRIGPIAGTGGMGTVYEATDLRDGQRVALKLLHASAIEHAGRFEREARVLAELSHPHIVRYLAHGSLPNGSMFLAMEWLAGETLTQRLAQRPLSLTASMELIERVAEALAVAHRRGVIHRDIKPGNIMLIGGQHRHVKLLDFGIARLTADAGEITRTGIAIGTPGYMSPEQVRCSRTIDARADVYSLACVWFRCIAGRAPFVGRDPMAVLAKIALEEAPRVRDFAPHVPEALDDLLARMLSHHASGRPSDGAAVAAAIRALGAIDEAHVGPTSVRPPAITTGEQRLIAVVLAKRAAPAGGWQRDATDSVLRPGPSDAELVALDAAASDEGPTSMLTQPSDRSPEAQHDRHVAAQLRDVTDAHGARIVLLADGSAAATLASRGAATDLAVRAARCALAISHVAPSAMLALAIGRAEVDNRLPMGDAIDRAVGLLEQHAHATSPDRVRIDGVTAGLLDARFEIAGPPDARILVRERDEFDGAQMLLGRATPFTGRERELVTLEAIYAECVSEPVARCVLITAPAGVGKSRLRSEFVQRLLARSEAPAVLLARGDPMRAGSPYGMWTQALARAFGLQRGDDLAARRAKLRERLARNLAPGEIDRVATFLGEILGAELDDDAASVQLRSARAEAMLMGDQIRRAGADLLAAETAAYPVVLVLEDLQWGDLPSAQFVDAALRNLRDRPLLVLALARPEVLATFPGLFAAHDVTQMQLAPLTRKACEKFVHGVLGTRVDAARIEQIVSQSGGNAFCLEELVRAAGEGNAAGPPETVRAMIQSRLEAMESDARRVLRAASVYGTVFWASGVSALLGGEADAATVSEWLDELTKHEWIHRRGESAFRGEVEFAFRQSMVRDAAYAMLTERDQRVGHCLAGEWLASSGEREALVLAEHFRLGGEPARAVRWYLCAVRDALEGDDLAAVLHLADDAIACGASDAALCELRLCQAEAHRWRGENKDAALRASEALAGLKPGSALGCRAAGELATASGRIGDLERLQTVAATLLTVTVDRDALGAHRIATARCAIQLFHAGHHALAESLMSLAHEGIESIREAEPLVGAWIDTAMQSRMLNLGDPAAAWRAARSGAVEFERAGDLRGMCMQNVNVGYTSMEMGGYAEAERVLRQSIATAERMRLSDALAIAQSNLGLTLALSGKLEEAMAVQRKAIEAMAAQSNKLMEGCSRNYLAIAAWFAGDYPLAESEARAAIAVLTRSPAAAAYARATLARVLCETGRVGEAVAMAREAVAATRTLGMAEEGDAAVQLALVEALHAARDAAGAREAVRAAKERLLARASRIADPVMRTRFLEDVADHARTLQLADAWE